MTYALTGKIELWVAALDNPNLDMQRIEQVLSADEIKRAETFRFPHLQRRSLSMSALVRFVTAYYLGEDPGRVNLGTRQRGKPFLIDAPALSFNVSHSGNLALVGVTGGADLGVDIEKEREIPDIPAIAREFFGSTEAAAILGLVGPKRIHAFFNCWTRKEAFIKATGEGLYRDLRSFEVSIDDRPVSTLLRLEDGNPADWEIHSFTPAPGYIGAAAVRGTDVSLTLRPFDLDAGARRYSP